MVANRLTAAWKQGRQGGGRGYYESDPASGVAVSVVNVNPPRLERTSPEATCSPLSWTVRLDRKWRGGRSCYVTFQAIIIWRDELNEGKIDPSRQ